MPGPRVSQLLPALPLPVEHFASLAPWPAERLAALAGRCRGVLLRDWADHCRRRFGPTSVTEVRARAGPVAALVPDQPDLRDWLPAAAQIALTDAIVACHLGGHTMRLEALLREDALRDLTRVHRLLARAMGPHGGYRQVQGVYHKLYDVGRFRADVGDRTAVLHCAGAELFANPTWRVLQLFAHRAALHVLTGRDDGEVTGVGDGNGGFWIRMRWK
ncbi:MAG: hypothetical protein EXR79_15300 [Myxococcales bacterium]|nr:hypothetical protein [Myxococcales bacterium]